jgi:putative PIN family toxin of toxin-antitoxin system
LIRAVPDTNTIVAEVLEPRGGSARLLRAARLGQFALLTSTVIVDEVVRTLNADRIRRRYLIGPHDVLAILRFLERDTAVTALTQPVQGVATHPEDDLILATAVSGDADYLVT